MGGKNEENGDKKKKGNPVEEEKDDQTKSDETMTPNVEIPFPELPQENEKNQQQPKLDFKELAKNNKEKTIKRRIKRFFSAMLASLTLMGGATLKNTNISQEYENVPKIESQKNPETEKQTQTQSLYKNNQEWRDGVKVGHEIKIEPETEESEKQEPETKSVSIGETKNIKAGTKYFNSSEEAVLYYLGRENEIKGPIREFDENTQTDITKIATVSISNDDGTPRYKDVYEQGKISLEDADKYVVVHLGKSSGWIVYEQLQQQEQQAMQHENTEER